MATSTIPAQHLTNEGLVKAFYASYVDNESQTRELAQEIVNRKDAMWNWDVAVLDAEDELSA